MRNDIDERRPARAFAAAVARLHARVGTRLRLQPLGFGVGPNWDETRLYFERAWGAFLQAFVAYAERHRWRRWP